MTTRRFAVVQTSAAQGNAWDWSMHIEPVGTVSLEQVRSVTYGLHPVFPNPNRVICKRDGGFALVMPARESHNQTWGSFDVRVTITLVSGEREIQVVPLLLKNPDGLDARVLLPVSKDADFAECRTYFEFLKAKGGYGYARQVLDQASASVGKVDAPARLEWIGQQRALCTYKDSSLPNDTRLRDALLILETQCGLDLERCANPETLGLGGAIYKRLWDTTRTRRNLEFSLAYYDRAYRRMLEHPQSPEYDAGAYAGVNVAHVSELLAAELMPGVADETRGALLARADGVRKELADRLPVRSDRDQWWVAVTLLDVYFCLACADERHAGLLRQQASRVADIDASPWQLESTGSQLLRAARLQKKLRKVSADAVDELLKETIRIAFRDAVEFSGRGNFEGKVGLGLSGGGFRASLFHIGVLARMAELDELRDVEVISCVSGGSIVGAHYYLLLRQLLQSKPDHAITREDYITLVSTLLDQFLEGVQKNIRMRVAAGFWSNLRMIFQPSSYSRTQRLGDLYEKYLYSQVEDGDQDSKRWLSDAFIVPMGKSGRPDNAFSPKADNWRRSAKVPVLVLNATSLNTGRNWQFTASYMGEPLSYGTTADATERLQAVYYSQAPECWRRYRLGEAVAASSCVPALFTPIVLPKLFENHTVRLVDGGVHDNQGTRALLDQDCELLFVSDASGQMDSQLNPSHGEIGVALRTNSILQARVRIAQHQELQARVQAGQVRQCAFLHLRKDVEQGQLNAIGQGEDSAVETPAPPPLPRTDYGIDKKVQVALAGLRTDLDSFTDREALSLMCSGYQMANRNLSRPGTQQYGKWRFLGLANACAGENQPDLEATELLRHLQVGSKLAFKVWHLNGWLNFLRLLLLATIAVGVLGGLVYLWVKQVMLPLGDLDLGGLARSALVLLLPFVLAFLIPMGKRFFQHIERALNPGSVLGRIIVGLVMACGGWFICRLHLWTFDRLFLSLGRVPREKTP